MNTKEVKVAVVVREGVDLNNLARHDGPLAHPCGTLGPYIAKAVLHGNGKAEISLLNIQAAIDTQEGVESILDNFQLYDTATKHPLVWSLVAAYLKN